MSRLSLDTARRREVWERMDQTRADLLEEKLSHLERVTDDLSDIVARQSDQIDLLERRIAMLMLREAEREADQPGAIPLADQKPPHW